MSILPILFTFFFFFSFSSLVSNTNADAHRLMTVLLNGVHWPSVRARAAQARLGPAAPPPPEVKRPPHEIECKLCYEDFSIEETFAFDCTDAHRACVTCAMGHCRMSLDSGELPKCIQHSDCGHQVTKLELQQLEGLVGEGHALRTMQRGGKKTLVRIVTSSTSYRLFFVSISPF
jgi:hypothetical protein